MEEKLLPIHSTLVVTMTKTTCSTLRRLNGRFDFHRDNGFNPLQDAEYLIFFSMLRHWTVDELRAKGSGQNAIASFLSKSFDEAFEGRHHAIQVDDHNDDPKAQENTCGYWVKAIDEDQVFEVINLFNSILTTRYAN